MGVLTDREEYISGPKCEKPKEHCKNRLPELTL